MSMLQHWYPGDPAVEILLIVALGVLLLSTAAWVAAFLLPRKPAARHLVLVSALFGCLAMPVLAVAFSATGFALFAIPLLPARSPDPLATYVTLDRPLTSNDRETALADALQSAHGMPTPDPRSSAPAVAQLASAQPMPTLERGPNPIEWPRLLQATTTLGLIIWTCGSGLFLLRLARSWRSLEWLRRASVPLEDATLLCLMDEVGRALKTRSLPRVLGSPSAPAPLAFGCFRPAIILPDRLMGAVSHDELRDVLLHEMAHLIRRDPVVVLLQEAARALYWPILPVHALIRALRLAREELCDNYVLQARDALSYGETLLHLAELSLESRPLVAAVGIIEWRCELERRIAALLDQGRSTITRSNRWLVCAVALLFVAGGAMTSAIRLSAGGQEGEGTVSNAPEQESAQPSGKSDTHEDEPQPKAKEGKQAAKQTDASPTPWRAFGKVTDQDGKGLPGVEISAHCGHGTLRRTGVAKSGEDGRYELNFGPGIVPSRGNTTSIQAATIMARMPGYFEENLNRQADGSAAYAISGEVQVTRPYGPKRPIFLPDRPLEIDFVMRPAARVAGKLVDEQGHPLARYSVSLTGPELPPLSSVLASAVADEQGRFALEDIPTTFRFQFIVRKADVNPPWDDSWASAALKFERPENGDLRARFGNRQIRIQQFALRVAGPGAYERTATVRAGNAGTLDLVPEDPADAFEQSDTLLAAKSAVLTLRNPATEDVSRSLIKESVPVAPAIASKTHLVRTRPNQAGEFAISFENPGGSDLVSGKHQVIFQVFVGVSRKPIREKIFRQLDVRNGRYEVPVKIAPEWIDDSRVSITFVSIQPDHDAWVKAFFHDGTGTSYSGIWIGDGGMLAAIPIESGSSK
jgi:beta-lactamase regulating signal transducer with metallopeptidase domain